MPLQVTAPTLGAQAKVTNSQADMGTKAVFLKMLVAQMQNQDPLNPADSTQMSSQLAQFNMVEQQIDTNKYLQQMAVNQGTQTSSLDMASAGYLGHTVMVNQTSIQNSGSGQGFSATLGNNAEAIYVTITDGYGTPVRTMSLSSMPAGDLQLNWDGKDDVGQAVPQGSYNIYIEAYDAVGTPVSAAIQHSGVVDAVRASPTGIELIVNGIPTSLSDITEVRL